MGTERRKSRSTIALLAVACCLTAAVVGAQALAASYGKLTGASGGGGGLSTVNTAAPVSGDGSIGTPVTIASGAIALAKMASQADQTFLGNVSGGSASPIALTVTQARTALSTFVPVAGTALTDASATITPSSSVTQIVDSPTLTAGRTTTLSTASMTQGQMIRFVRTGGGAFTRTIVDSSTSATICTLAQPSGSNYPACVIQLTAAAGGAAIALGTQVVTL